MNLYPMVCCGRTEDKLRDAYEKIGMLTLVVEQAAKTDSSSDHILQENERLQDELEETQRLLAEEQARTESLKKKVRAFKTTNMKNDALLTEATTRRDELEEMNASQLTTIAQLTIRNETLLTLGEEAIGQKERMEEDVEQLKNELDSEKARADRAEGEVVHLNRQFPMWGEKIKQLEELIRGHDQELFVAIQEAEAANEELAEERESNLELDYELADLQLTIQNMDEEEEELNEKIEQLCKEKEAVEKQLKKALADVTCWIQQHDDLYRHFQDKYHEAAKFAAENKELTEQLQQADEELDWLRGDIDALTTALEENNSTIDELMREMAVEETDYDLVAAPESTGQEGEEAADETDDDFEKVEGGEEETEGESEEDSEDSSSDAN